MDVSGIWHSQEKEKMMIDPFCPLSCEEEPA